MKYLLIILTLASISVYGQSHSGTYFTSKKNLGFESDIFQFDSDGTFKYAFFTCTGEGLGKGEYKIIKGDSLQY